MAVLLNLVGTLHAPLRSACSCGSALDRSVILCLLDTLLFVGYALGLRWLGENLGAVSREVEHHLVLSPSISVVMLAWIQHLVLGIVGEIGHR